MKRWSGVFPAVTTKLHSDGAIDSGATQASIERLIDNGVSGVIVLPCSARTLRCSRTRRKP